MVSLKPREVNMLEGSLVRSILVYSFPLIISNLLQILYSAADMIVVTLSGTEGAIGSIGTTGALINLVVNLFIGFSVGANVVVARRIGAGDPKGAERAVHTSILMSVLFGLAGAGIGIVISRPMLTLMGDEGRILSMAAKYSVIRFAGIPFLSLTNFGIAIYRAKGDTQTPLYILTASGILNVLLNLFFVLVFHMDVDGVALATILSQLFSAVLLLVGLSRTDGLCRFSVRKLKICMADAKEILSVGIPAGVQGALYSVSNMIIASSIIRVNNTLCPGGSAVIDGNSAAANLGQFVTTMGEAMALACVSFTSQHYGAKKFRRMGTVFRDFFLLSTAIVALPTVLVLLFRIPLLRLYVTDPMALETGTLRLYLILGTYLLALAMNLSSNILRGLGKSSLAALITLVFTCVLRVIWIYTVFEKVQTLTSVYISYPISWGIAAIFHTVCFLRIWKRLKRENPEPAGKGA